MLKQLITSKPKHLYYVDFIFFITQIFKADDINALPSVFAGRQKIGKPLKPQHWEF